MARLLALLVLFLTGCASSAVPPASAPVTLQGIPGTSTCREPSRYGGSFAVLHLAKPVAIGSLKGVTEVELIMDEPNFAEYDSYIGRPSRVVCRLGESSLCGYAQVSCGVTAMSVGP